MSSKPPSKGDSSNKPRLSQNQPGVRFPDDTPVASGGAEKPKANAPSSARPKTSAAQKAASRPLTSTNIKPSGKAAPPPPPKSSNLLPLLIIGGIVLVAVVAFVAVLAISGGSNKATPAAASSATSGSTAAGDIPVGPDDAAQVETFPDLGGGHIQQGAPVSSAGISYNSDPPTSGPHWPSPATWGVFAQPLPDEMTVHNLEHGGVIISYYCPQGCSGTVNNLAAYARRYPAQNFTGVILAPRNSLPNGARIALTSWTHRLLLKSFDQAKIQQFISNYINKGPEKDPSFKP